MLAPEAGAPEAAAHAVVACLGALPGVWARTEEPMARHTPLRAGGPAEVWAVVADPGALIEVLHLARRHGVSWRVHWPLSDGLVRDGGQRGLVIRPGRGFEGMHLDGEALVLGSAAAWAGVRGLPGDGWWSPLAAWPGTVGGLMESADRSWIAGSCVRLRWARGRSVEEVAVPAGSAPPEVPSSAVLMEVTLRPPLRVPRRLARARPPTPGTLFADPDLPGQTSGAVLGRAGIPGTRLRQWRLSAVEPGTVVHLGGGCVADLLLLAKGVADRVDRCRAVSLDLRIPLSGDDPSHRRGHR